VDCSAVSNIVGKEINVQRTAPLHSCAIGLQAGTKNGATDSWPVKSKPIFKNSL